MRKIFFLSVFLLFCAEATSLAQVLPTPSAQSLVCPCASTNATSVQGRGRGVPAYIVLRGQRFGGSFGDPIGAGRGYDSGRGGGIPFFPNPVNSPELGGGISPQTAREYGTMLGPFKAGVPTVATIIAEIVDVFGQVVTTATQSTSALVLVAGNAQVPDGKYFPDMRIDAYIPYIGYHIPNHTSGHIAFGRNGRFEWENIQLHGIASTTVTLTLSDSAERLIWNFPNPTATLATCFCPTLITVQGGFPLSASIATQAVNLDSSLILYPRAQGPFAIPGVVAGWPPQGEVFVRARGGYDGSVPSIIMGEKVRLPHTGKGTYPAIAVLIRDRYGNSASFSTTVTLSLSGCTPPVDQVRTPLVGNVVQSMVTWGEGYLGQEQFFSTSASLIQVASNIALFPDFTVLGATSNQCSLVVTVSRCGDPYIPGIQFGGGCMGCSFFALPVTLAKKNTSEVHCSPGNTSAIVSLFPARAVAIAPVIMPDPNNQKLPVRVPPQMVIGRSNNADPKTWFSVQAVDEFGNRVDRGPYAYNGGEARISFAAPEDGLPRSSDGTFQFTRATSATIRQDPFVKANTQQHSARGITARAVNGLYTFNNFTPLGMASRTNADVVLTFEDTALKGVRAPPNPFGLRRPPFQPIPPITTATTTFIAPTSLGKSQAGTRLGGLVLAPNPVQSGEEQVTVQFFVPQPTMVRIEVYALHGARLLAVEKRLLAGEALETLPLSGYAAGAYFVRVQSGADRTETAVMTVLR